jgi:RNA polymerase sigma-70 factor (ECF subfamily)
MSASLDRSLDSYLAAAARAGDRQARETLVRRWTPKLAGLAWRLLGERSAVEDAVQDAWIDILKGLPRLRSSEAFPAFAFRIVQRRCARVIRTRQGERRLLDGLAAEPEPEAQDLEREADGERVKRALVRLPGPQQAALWLFHLEEMSVAEIAVVLDVPAGTVKTRLMHGRLKLAEIFKGGQDE